MGLIQGTKAPSGAQDAVAALLQRLQGSDQADRMRDVLEVNPHQISNGSSVEIIFLVKAGNRGVVVTEVGSYLRLIHSCITQLNAQGLSRTCNENKESEEGMQCRRWCSA